MMFFERAVYDKIIILRPRAVIRVGPPLLKGEKERAREERKKEREERERQEGTRWNAYLVPVCTSFIL